MQATRPRNEYTSTQSPAQPGPTPRVIAYYDTVEAALRRGLSRHELACLQASDASSTDYWQPRGSRKFRPWLRKVKIQQPGPGALDFLASLPVQCMSRIDLAFEFPAATMTEAEADAEILQDCASLKWGGRYKRECFEATSYASSADDRRGLTVYPARSKITGLPVSRLEIRLRCPEACKAIGLREPTALASADPMAVFHHHVRFARVRDPDTLDQAVERDITDRARRTARRHARCRDAPSEIESAKAWRAALAHAAYVECGMRRVGRWSELPSSFHYRWWPQIARRHFAEFQPPSWADTALMKPRTILSPMSNQPNLAQSPQLAHPMERNHSEPIHDMPQRRSGNGKRHRIVR